MSQVSRRGVLRGAVGAAGTVAFGGALLSACSRSDGSTTGTTSTTSSTATATVNIMSDEFKAGLSKEDIATFQSANNCVLKIVPYDATKLNAAVAAGNPPDLVRTEGATEMPNLIARGLCENLDPYFAASSVLKPSDFASIVDVYRYDGKEFGKGSTYGFPVDYSQDAMLWFNQDIMDKAGASVPPAGAAMSYDELLDLGKRVTSRRGDKIVTYGLDMSWTFVVLGHIAQMVAQQGESLFNDTLDKIDFQQPAARRAFQFYVDWAQAHVGTSPVDPASDWNGPLYNARRMAIISYGYWFRGWINGTSSGEDTKGLIDKSVFRPAPVMGSNRVDSCMSGTGVYMPVKAKNKDLAFKAMELLFGGEPAKRHARGGAGLPPLKSHEALLPRATPTDKAQYDEQIANLQHFQVLKFSPYLAKKQIDTTITKAIEPVMKGQASLDDALAKLQQEADTLIAAGKATIGGQ